MADSSMATLTRGRYFVYLPHTVGTTVLPSTAQLGRGTISARLQRGVGNRLEVD